MLNPPDLIAAQYGIATKPADGYESQLRYSTTLALDMGIFTCLGANSGIYSPSPADAAELAANPMELLVMLETDISPPTTVTPVVTIQGLDGAGAAMTGTATFQVPGYARNTAKLFPKCTAVEAITSLGTTSARGQKFASISSVTVACGADLGTNQVKFKVLAMPSVDSFQKISLKTKLDWDPRVPMPHAIQDGRNKGAYVKPGEIEIGKVDITAKNPNWADGLANINGVRVTGLIAEVKEDKVIACYTYLKGMILTWNASSGESIEPQTLTCQGMCEDTAIIPAH